VVVLRPGFIYGERDRTVLPRVADQIARGTLVYIGPKGDQVLNTTYVGNLTAAILLALEKPQAVGQTYNITDGEPVTRRQFYEAIADGLGLPRPTGWRRWPMVRLAAWLVEGSARLAGAKQAPFLTQAKLKFIGLNLDFSIDKARCELGYEPPFRFAEAMRRTLEWARANRPG
jgi:nucleoside-diphosphate-sugar epimerase